MNNARVGNDLKNYIGRISSKENGSGFYLRLIIGIQSISILPATCNQSGEHTLESDIGLTILHIILVRLNPWIWDTESSTFKTISIKWHFLSFRQFVQAIFPFKGLPQI